MLYRIVYRLKKCAYRNYWRYTTQPWSIFPFPEIRSDVNSRPGRSGRNNQNWRTISFTSACSHYVSRPQVIRHLLCWFHLWGCSRGRGCRSVAWDDRDTRLASVCRTLIALFVRRDAAFPPAISRQEKRNLASACNDRGLLGAWGGGLCTV